MTTILWFTGLSGSGKTTLALALKKELETRGKSVDILDGDVVRSTLNKNLGFSREDIRENNRLIAELAKSKVGNYDYILIPIISPYREDRTMARSIIGSGFIELFVDAPLPECIRRDVKGLYKKALAGEIKDFVGIAETNPYEKPENPEMHICTENRSLQDNLQQMLNYLKKRNENELEKKSESGENYFPESFCPETKLAIKAALSAGKEVLDIYSHGFTTTYKKDTTPITEADLKSNEIITQILSSSKHYILSEENTEKSIGKNTKEDTEADIKEDLPEEIPIKFWVVDPLDGTADFINKTGEFAVMIALVKEEKPILGVIYQPVGDRLFVAQKDCGTFLKEQGEWIKLKVNHKNKLEKCKAAISRHHLEEIEKDFLGRVGISSFSQKGSCGLKVAEICLQKAELYFTRTNKIKIWDTAAAYCLITEAGGEITNLLGEELKYNLTEIYHQNGVLVTNGKIHGEISRRWLTFLEKNPS